MTKRATTKAVAKETRRGPTEREQQAMAKAAQAFLDNRIDPPAVDGKLVDGGIQIASPHDDDTGHALAVAHTLGLNGVCLASALQNQILNLRGTKTPTTAAEARALAQQLEEGLAFVQAVAPASPLESVIATQMWASHLSMMNLSRMMNRADQFPQFEAYGKLMNKAARTFAAQVDTLQRLRTGGKQTHEVRYVYVDQRTQTVVNAPGGGGGPFENLPQPHTKALAHAPVAPLWSADEAGDALPVSGGEGPQAVSDARRDQPRRSDRSRKREIHPRTADQ